ncbi:MAG: FecR domain-containing protein [Myxococcaceae bacterium]
MNKGSSQEAESRYGDALLSLAALAGALLSAGLLMGHAPGPRLGEQASAIAEVSFASADIRRRPARSLSWEDVSRGAVVHEQDSIFVPPGAAAQITFHDGSRLEIDENSLVVLEAPPEAAPRVELKKGSLSGLTRTGGIDIESETGRTSLAGNSEARVDVDGKAARIEVYSGQAKVVGKAGEQTLGANQIGSVAGDGKPGSLASASVQLQLPRRNERLFFRGTPGPVTLSWSGALSATSRLQIARDRGFGFVVVSEPAAGGELRYSPPAPGIYWWRVVDAGVAVSEARRLSVIEDLPPVALTPRQREVVWVTAGRPLPFAWTEVVGAATYRLELSADPQFQTLAYSALAEQPRLVVERELPEATYHWRVRVDDAERGASGFSRPLAFRLIHKALPSAPELMDPEIEVETEPKQP